MDAYVSTFQSDKLYTFMTRYFAVGEALERIAEFGQVCAVVEVTKNVFLGVEVNYERAFGPVETSCEGNNPPPPPPPPTHTHSIPCYPIFILNRKLI